MNNVERRQGDFSHVCKRAYAVAFQTSRNTHTQTHRHIEAHIIIMAVYLLESSD